MKRSLLTAALALAIAAATAAADAPPANMPGQLPPGHPTIEQMNAAATQTSAKGSLTVSVLPGTSGAHALSNEPITVELYHRNAPLKKYELTTDAQGKLTIPDLPVMPPVQALISVKHAGLLQQIVSPEMNVAAPTQSLEMKVYESTDAEPAWNVAMQHMILQWNTAKKAVHVVEMLATNSPADRAWLGNPTPTGRVTMAIPLPAGATDIELGGGFDEQSTQFVNGKILTADPLFPGRTEFRISYNIPADNGSAQLVISAPAAVDNLIVFAPADGATLVPTGLTGGDIMDAGQGKVRMFRAQNLAAGATATLTISNLLSSAPLSASPGAESPLSARNVAIGGAFLLALVGAGMMLAKKPQPKKA